MILMDEIQREAKLLINWMSDEGLSLKECENVVRRAVLENALFQGNHSISRTAEILGMHRNTVGRELRRLKVKRVKKALLTRLSTDGKEE